MVGKSSLYYPNFCFRNPNIDPKEVGVTTSTLWPPYNATTQHFLEVHADKDVVSQYLFAREYNFWNDIVPYVMEKTKRCPDLADDEDEEEDDVDYSYEDDEYVFDEDYVEIISEPDDDTATLPDSNETKEQTIKDDNIEHDEL